MSRDRYEKATVDLLELMNQDPDVIWYAMIKLGAPMEDRAEVMRRFAINMAESIITREVTK